jgi:predicted  nucleic acid-binding Zn-ribbon protein
VQELDSRLDALRYQASHPPEGAELKDLESSRASLRGQAADLQIQVDDLTRAQRKADDDVEQVKARRVRDQQRLDSGAVTNPKDLERLQHELVSLDRRISELEDTELEIMAHLEDAQRDLAEVQAHVVEQDARAEELNTTRVERLTGLKAEGADVVARRKEAAAELPADLLALYERLREQKAGVGAALLRQRRCAGCSLELNSGDLATVSRMPDDEVARCEECGRILVRTGESGL